MEDRPDWSHFNLGTPAIYEITVRGYLDESWSNQLGGIAIHNTKTTDEVSISVLQGELVDQAALFGVLNSLYGLGFPIMSVECEPAKGS
jgi:hypothetical protein